MKKCTECNAKLGDQDVVCSACGHAVSGQTSPATGTLNVGQHYEESDSASVEKAREEAAADSGQKAVNRPESGGTLNTDVSESGSGATGKDSAGSTLSAPKADVGTNEAPNTDKVRTLNLDDEREGKLTDTPAVERTIVDNPDDSADDSAVGKSGSAGKLRRLWEQAAGSSANPMHSLKAEGQATDSVFNRVATRTVSSDADSKGDDPDYQIIKTVGEGAMGVVYAAKQKAIGRTVAIKAIKPSHRKKDDSRRKFFYEAQITGELDHPNIVPIYELGATNEGMLFYSMKLIGGNEWQSVMKSRSRDENLDIFMKIADAVAFAHAKRVIHRDIKPENVMLGTFGEVYLTDWGLAVNLNSGRDFTLGGTPAYMAPEMAAHRKKLIDTTSDIYLLGAVLFQIVTGIPPHGGRTVTEALRAAHTNEIVEVREQDALLDIAYRAMETDPDARYSTVEAMQEALRQYRRNAESIALTGRSEELLESAIKSNDYERFSRTLFGFQDAIELWPDNKAAREGVLKARLAYGECAFNKADYDLCLQTLDKSVKVEADLYARAQTAKRAAENQKARFATLRRVLAAVILLALGIMSALAIYALSQRTEAIAKRIEAETALEEARRQEKLAKENAEEADRQRMAAVTNLEEAQRQEKLATENAEEADRQRMAAVTNLEEAQRQEKLAKENAEEANRQKMAAITNLEEAQRQEKLANENAEEANRQRIAADDARRLAENRTAQVELGNYQSNLSLAKAQTDNLDIATAEGIITQLEDPLTWTALAKQGNIPEFKNWALDRISMMTNKDLPSIRIPGRITCMDFGAGSSRGVAGTESGEIILVQLDERQLQMNAGITMGSPIDSIAIAPDGNEVVFSVSPQGSSSTVYRWDPNSETPPLPISYMGQRSIQGLAFSESKIIGGINGGVYVWNRSGEWETSRPLEIRDLRGRLKTIQITDSETALVLAELDQQMKLYRLDLVSGDVSLLTLPEPLDRLISTIAMTPDGSQVLLGTVDGKLFQGDSGASSFAEIQPVKHQSAIRSIEIGPNGAMLTTANEPVIHVWQQELSGGWKYDSWLTGTTGNVSAAVFAGSPKKIMGAGEEGRLLVWDLDRQKQRMRLERFDATGTEKERQLAPVASFVANGMDQPVWSLDGNGVLDKWNPLNGRTILLEGKGENRDGSRFSWIGHTPGSRLADFSLDESSSVLVTSAILPGTTEAERVYLTGQQNALNEFCLWNSQTGEMLNRWYSTSDSKPRVSVVNDGKQVLVADSKQTTIFSFDTPGKPLDLNEKLRSFNANFAVQNPVEREKAMLVKSSGALWMYDFSNPDSGSRFDDLAIEQKVPLQGAWSNDGRRFWLLLSDGRIEQFAWNGTTLVYVDGGRIQLNLSTDASTEDYPDYRLQSHLQADMGVIGQNKNEQLGVAIRLPGNPPKTILTTGLTGRESDAALSPSFRSIDGNGYLSVDDAGSFSLIENSSPLIAGYFPMTAGHLMVLENGTGIIFDSSKEPEDVRIVGRPEVQSADSSGDSSRMIVLGRGDYLWDVNLNGSSPVWKPFGLRFPGSQSVDLNHNGQRLLLVRETGSGPESLLIDVENRKVLSVIPNAVAGYWSPDEPHELAIALTDGSVQLFDAKGRAVREISGPDADGMQVTGLHGFVEPWSSELPTNKWLLVHLESENGGIIKFVPLNADFDATGNVERTLSIGQGRIVAASPTDGLFVTGGDGNVTVWFAVPSLGEPGRELFSLTGHGGANLTAMRFTRDGKTLLTADSLNRVFGWLSQDPLGGMSPNLDPEDVVLIRQQGW